MIEHTLKSCRANKQSKMSEIWNRQKGNDNHVNAVRNDKKTAF